MTSIFLRILYVGRTRQWSREKYWHFSFFIAFLDSLGQEEYVAWKKWKKHVWKYIFFALKFGTFWAFFWHVRTCHVLVLVSVLLNFQMSWHWTISTKLSGGAPLGNKIPTIPSCRRHCLTWLPTLPSCQGSSWTTTYITSRRHTCPYNNYNKQSHPLPITTSDGSKRPTLTEPRRPKSIQTKPQRS